MLLIAKQFIANCWRHYSYIFELLWHWHKHHVTDNLHIFLETSFTQNENKTYQIEIFVIFVHSLFEIANHLSWTYH